MNLLNKMFARKRLLISVCATAFVLAGCGGSTSTEESETSTSIVSSPSSDNSNSVSTAGILCDYNNDSYNDSDSVQAYSTVYWSCTSDAREFTGNGIPDHAVGQFPNPNNPNSITQQSVSGSMTLFPSEANTASFLGGPRGVTGYVLNGIKIDAGTGGSCGDYGTSCSLADPSGEWNIEALGQSQFDFGTDENNAHVQPTGEYHYHGMPERFIEKQGGSDTSMTLIGWAADGFPIYARYGYSDPMDANSAIVVVTGSYQHVSTVSESRPPVDVYEMGTFAQDWEYVENSGDLDECNGRFGVTPEFPEGIFHYFATDTYPFFQRCVSGNIN